MPDPQGAAPDGLVAVGGDLNPDRLLLAYKKGVFPWYDSESEILWWSPNPRFVLFPAQLKVSKSMRKLLNRHAFEISFNKNFPEVIRLCQTIKRKQQDGTWITKQMEVAYIRLFELGYVQSVEVWLKNELVGGLYGVRLGNIFFGESMFSTINNASKYGFIHLVQKLSDEGVTLIDCQVFTEHLASLGAELIERNRFLKLLKQGV